jgi:integrase
MAEIELEGVHKVKKRLSDGSIKFYFYHRETGKALGSDPTDPEFMRKLRDARAPTQAAPDVILPGSFKDLTKRYRRHTDYTTLSPDTIKDYKRYLGIIDDTYGNDMVRDFERIAAFDLQEVWADTPRTANYLLAVLSKVLSFGADRGFRKDNPIYKFPKLDTDGSYQPWTPKQLDIFREKAPAHLVRAMEVGLYTGQRRADCLVMAKPHRDGNVIAVVQSKTDERLWIPLHRKLRAVLEDTPDDQFVYLVDETGKPWKRKDTFTKKFSQAIRDCGMDSGLEGISFHGLRHNACDELVTAGCTAPEGMAVTGHKNLATFQKYLSKGNQRRLAEAAILKWEARQLTVETENGNQGKEGTGNEG